MPSSSWSLVNAIRSSLMRAGIIAAAQDPNRRGSAHPRRFVLRVYG